MLSFLKNSFVWQFAAGFAIGAVGLVALHPSEARAAAMGVSAPTHVVQR